MNLNNTTPQTNTNKMNKRTILIYGRTRSGKSTQIGALSEHVMKTTGKKTRLYTSDKGGYEPIIPYVKLGLIDVVEQAESDPWIFLNKAVRGFVRNVEGKWILPDNSGVGMFVFESMTAFADALMTDLANKSAAGINIGGSGNVSFSVSGDGESLKVGGSNMAHYQIVQARITDEIWQSQRLDAPYICWSASVSKDEDTTASGKVLGPAVVGKALTHEVPRWFNLTFRIDCLPAQGGKPERHVLYLGNGVDMAAGNAVGLGNTRTPLDSKPLPPSLEPANIVQAITMIDAAQVEALETIRKRLGAGRDGMIGGVATI